MTKALRPKHVRFVQEYLIDLNATQAAIRAGYSAKTAEQQGPRLLGNAGIAKAIFEAEQRRSARTEIAADAVLHELSAVGFSDIGDILDFQRTRTPVETCQRDSREGAQGHRILEGAAVH